MPSPATASPSRCRSARSRSSRSWRSAREHWRRSCRRGVQGGSTSSRRFSTNSCAFRQQRFTISEVTEQMVGPSVDELLPGQTQEIARLGMLVEAAGRLFGTLDLDAVLPEVLELARSTLAVDAYSLWRLDPEQNRWFLQASSGLSATYV